MLTFKNARSPLFSMEIYYKKVRTEHFLKLSYGKKLILENYEILALEKHNELRAFHRDTGALVLDAELSTQAKVDIIQKIIIQR